MNKRKFLTLVFLIGYFVNTYAATVQQFAQNLKSFNKTYIIPLILAGIGLYAIISGVMRIGKIRKGGEEQSDAVLNWLGSLLWPAIVIIISEGIILGFSAIYT